MVLAVIVAEGNECRGVGEMLGKESLNFGVSVFQELVFLLVITSMLLGNAMADKVSVYKNVINAVLVNYLEQFHHVLCQ